VAKWQGGKDIVQFYLFFLTFLSLAEYVLAVLATLPP